MTIHSAIVPFSIRLCLYFLQILENHRFEDLTENIFEISMLTWICGSTSLWTPFGYQTLPKGSGKGKRWIGWIWFRTELGWLIRENCTNEIGRDACAPL